MLWTITKKQLLINVLSYRFVVGFILCQVLFVLATVILVNDYQERVKAYGESASREEERLGQVKVYYDLIGAPMTLYKPPAKLSPICTGFEKTLANQATLTYHNVPELELGRQEKNALLAALRSIDLVTVIQLVLGLLVLLSRMTRFQASGSAEPWLFPFPGRCPAIPSFWASTWEG